MAVFHRSGRAARGDALTGADRLTARLAPLVARPDGLLHHHVGKASQIVIAKADGDVVMMFCPLDKPLRNENLSGVMARVDPARPLLLKGRYTQAMLACLGFAPDPGRVFVMGAGGGRLPLVLRHLVGAQVFGAELDADVLAVSQDWLGLEPGPDLQIDVADARAHLTTQADGSFDHIYVDCYDAQGRVPASLCTVEALTLMRSKLSPGGVMTINLIESDPRFAGQLAAIVQGFAQVWVWAEQGTQVLFGLTRAAQPVPSGVPVGFDLNGHIRHLRPVPGFAAAAAALTDRKAFRGTLRNAACPCGSGRKFKTCCGRS